MNTIVHGKSRRWLVMLGLALFLAASATSLPLLLDQFASTTLVTPALADDYVHGGD